jgi:hypothetical protein
MSQARIPLAQKFLENFYKVKVLNKIIENQFGREFFIYFLDDSEPMGMNPIHATVNAAG